jgi:4-amino-4-deoxy-L-arabinose transferase-like glycosyltransferase
MTSGQPLMADSRRLSAAGHWVLVLLTLIAFGRGVAGLGTKSLWWDESLSLHRARQDLPTLVANEITLTDNLQQVVTVDNHPPFYFLLLRLARRLWGESEFALRFLSLAAAVALVPLLYATARRLIPGRPAALAAAALGALSPMYLWYGQETRMYTLVACLGLVTFYLYVRAFFDAESRRAGWIAAYVGVSTLLVMTHYLGALLIAAQVVGLAPILARQRRWRWLTIAAIVALLAVSLAALFKASTTMPKATARVGFRFIPLFELLRDLLNSFSLGLSVDVTDWFVIAIDLLFLLFLLIGLGWLIKRARRSAWLLAGYLFLPVLFIYLLSFFRPAYMTSRHLILVTPAFYLLAGAGLSAASRAGNPQPARGNTQPARRNPQSIMRFAPVLALAAVALMLAGIAYSTHHYFFDPRYAKEPHRDWGAYLREHVRPGDAVIVDPPHIAELYDYYADSDAPWVGLPLLDASRPRTVAKLQELVGSYDRVWLALSGTPNWGDRGHFPEKWLNQNAFRVDYKAFDSPSSAVLVASYVLELPAVGSLPDGAQPLDARFSPALRLAGYRLVSTAEPGRLLHVELFWAVDEPISDEASVVLRLVDEEGHVWGQGEQCPFNGLYPMAQWGPGTRLRDEHELAIEPGTPPGVYEMEVMLVSRPSDEGCLGERGQSIPPLAAATGRGDRVLLGDVQVGRPALPPTEAEMGVEGQRRTGFSELALLGEAVTPAELRPGDPLDVTLYWEAQQAPAADRRFRVQVVDEAGQVRAETVIRPAGDQYPTDRWQAGDRFKGQLRLWLPEDAAAGRYTMWLAPDPPPAEQGGLWGSLRRRLGCLVGDCDRLRLGVVEVAAQAGQEEGTALPPPPTGLAVSHPMEATLGGQVRFLGYDLSTDTLQVGETLTLTLYWQALRPIELSYHVFNHLTGPQGEVVAQKDGVPRQGAYPTNLWQTGEVVIDTYQVTVDPAAAPGQYKLETGLYRLESLKRLPVTDAAGQSPAGDRLLLSEITLLPPPDPYRSYLPVVAK